MQNFKKYGVAAAVAAVSVASTAQTVSTSDRGDAAIVPYYTAVGGRITGVHIVNTTAATQAVKFRMRRAVDSADAMDFNIVMSPNDEWTGYIGQDDDGVFVGTSDNTCTVPQRLASEGKAYIPSTYADGADEGYIEILGMGQTTATTGFPVYYNSLHVKGTPINCAAVERNFYRVTNAAYAAGHTAGANTVVAPGVHAHDLTSIGCTTAESRAASAENTAWLASSGTPAAASACSQSALASNWADTDDQALKVSYFIREGATEGEGGMEVGANAVHIEGFADGFRSGGQAAITNQVQLNFVTAEGGALEWDPLNFEFPNLGQLVGNTGTTTDERVNADANSPAEENIAHFTAIRQALQAESIVNEWADNAAASADWVVTLPGQYSMRDGVCQRYDEERGTACAAWTATAAQALEVDDDQLPIYLVAPTGSQLSIYDREEGVIAETGSDIPPGIDFSPSSSDEAAGDVDYLPNEVNVLVWGSDDGGVLGSNVAKTISTLEATEGWARLNITPKNTSPKAFFIGNDIEAGEYVRRATRNVGSASVSCSEAASGATSAAASCSQAEYLTHAIAQQGADQYVDVPVASIAVWKREFSDNAAANYGRAIEATIETSSAGYGGTAVSGLWVAS